MNQFKIGERMYLDVPQLLSSIHEEWNICQRTDQKCFWKLQWRGYIKFVGTNRILDRVVAAAVTHSFFVHVICFHFEGFPLYWFLFTCKIAIKLCCFSVSIRSNLMSGAFGKTGTIRKQFV